MIWTILLAAHADPGDTRTDPPGFSQGIVMRVDGAAILDRRTDKSVCNYYPGPRVTVESMDRSVKTNVLVVRSGWIPLSIPEKYTGLSVGVEGTWGWSYWQLTALDDNHMVGEWLEASKLSCPLRLMGKGVLEGWLTSTSRHERTVLVKLAITETAREDPTLAVCQELWQEDAEACLASGRKCGPFARRMESIWELGIEGGCVEPGHRW